ncbi:unnamed protein product [Calypogeia fissa]
MNQELGEIMYEINKDPVVESIRFMLYWGDTQPVFVEYYKTFWHTKITKWVVNLRRFKHANQNTNGAIERGHNTLKGHLRLEKTSKVGRKIVWLVEQLVHQLEHYYWCMSCMKWQGRVRNRKIEDIIWKAILKARTIPDQDVTFEEDGNIALVRSQKNPENWHAVEGWAGNACVCTCGSSVQGNTCKHQIKLLLLSGMGESKILHIYGTLYGTMVGGLAFEKAAWPESKFKKALVANVTLPVLQESPPENGGILSVQHDKTVKEEHSYDDYEKVLKQIWGRFMARQETVQGDVQTLLSTKPPDSLKPVLGADRSPFVRVVTIKESDQQILDKAALKCLDLNQEPDWHLTAAMGKYKKPTKVVSSQKSGKGKENEVLGEAAAEGGGDMGIELVPSQGSTVEMVPQKN